MDPVKQPRSTAQATELCERFAKRQGEIDAIQAQRDKDIAAINADADRALTSLIEERDLIATKLEPWWAKSGHELLEGKKKSVELGGCIVGTVTARPTLQVAGEAKDVVALMQGLRWAKPFLRTSYSIDRAAALKGLDGMHSAALVELGMSAAGGEDVFYVKRAEQDRVRQ